MEAVDVDVGAGGPDGLPWPRRCSSRRRSRGGCRPAGDTSVAPQLGGLADPPGDVVQGEQVGRAPQVERQRALGEAAELALERADVGVVDVAVADPGDRVADEARGAGRRRPRRRPPTSRPRAANRATISSSPGAWPAAIPSSTSRMRPRAPARRACGTSVGGSTDGPAVPGGVAPADLHDLGAACRSSMASLIRSGKNAPGSSRPMPSASDRSFTGEVEGGVDPAGRVGDEVGVDREAGASSEAGGLGGSAEDVEGRPAAARG